MNGKWERAIFDETCGGCGQRIRAGDAVKRCRPANLKRELARCAVCEGPAPPLPGASLDEPPTRRTRRMTPLSKSKPAWLPYRE